LISGRRSAGGGTGKIAASRSDYNGRFYAEHEWHRRYQNRCAEVSASRILIISQNDPAILRRQTLEANAHGFLMKADLSRDLIPAIERILFVNGQTSGRAS
jgi:DNA-binding NarL/FixJ family response regulator